MFSELTYKIVTLTYDDGMDSNMVVDWAYEMMQLGYEDENLYILAGLTKPVAYYEAANYLDATLKSLNLKPVQGEDAEFCQAFIHVLKIARRQNVKNELAQIKDWYLHYEYAPAVGNFADLHWAWDDLDDGYEQWYVSKEITLDNIEDIAVETALQWLGDNKQKHMRLFGFDMPAV